MEIIREIELLRDQIRACLKEECHHKIYPDELSECNDTNLTGHSQIVLDKLADAESNSTRRLTESNKTLEDTLTESRSDNTSLTKSKGDRQHNLGDRESSVNNSKEINKTLHEKLRETELNLTKAYSQLKAVAQDRICVMSINQQRLQSVAEALRNMQSTNQLDKTLHVVEKTMTGSLSVSEDDFELSNMVILVGIAEPRNMLISESEPSQLGAAYREALRSKKYIFLVFVDSKYPDGLKDSQPYHQSLKKMLESQSAIGDLAERNEFISVKFKEKDVVQKLNTAQCAAISNWVKRAHNNN